MIRSSLMFALWTLTLFVDGSVSPAQQPLPAEGDEQQLLAILESDAEMFDKAKACQRLAIIGTSNSVPVLATLLGDANLSHYARFGLESNPSPDVDEAFRNALGELSGQPLVGVINSIGTRRDAMATSALVDLANSDEESIASAAISALGAIASPDAVDALLKVLDGNHSLRMVAADACLTAADRLLIESRNAEAAAIFTALGKADLPIHMNVASRFGQIRSGEEDVTQLMTQYLSSDDNDLFRIGLELAHKIPGEATTQLLMDQMKTMSPARQTLMLYVIGSRGDRTALPAVLNAAESEMAAIRAAAIDVLGTLGDESTITTLLKAAASTDDSLRQAALQSLADLKGAGVNRLLMEKFSTSDERELTALVETAGRRGMADAMPKLLELMTSTISDLRNASIEALALTVGSNELPQMIDRLIAAGSSEAAPPLKDALQKACQRMADREAAADVIMSRMSNASPATRAALLDLLIYVGGPKALEAIGSAARSDDRALADSATQALGKWLTPDVAPVLLDLAKHGNEEFRVRCLRGYIRVIRQFGLKTNERLTMSKQAFDAATRDDERKLVLDTYTRFPTAASLNAVTSHLSDPALKVDAAKAAVMICEKIVNTDRKAVAAVIPKVIASASDPDILNRAKVVANQAGVN